MVYAATLTAAAAAALLFTNPAAAEGLYHKQSPVIQVNAKSYDRLIAKSNHTSIVEFYAPWCGHCKNLQPQWEKAARGLSGLAKVAAVNCDEDENKQFCGSMGVQGFPTLKIIKPGKKFGKPIVEDYNGPRESKDIIEAVISKIPNHVKKVTDKTLDVFASENLETAKAILFTEKGATSGLWKAVAVDFLGSVQVAQIRSTEKFSVKKYSITKFPTVVLVPAGEDSTPIVYDGPLKKPGLVEFLSQIAPPNPDPAPAKVKMPKSKTSKKPAATKKAEKKAKEDFESASSSHAKSEATEAVPTQASETIVEPNGATPSPDPKIEDVDWDKEQREAKHVTKLQKLTSDEKLVQECFRPRFGTCLLVFTSNNPAAAADATAAVENLAEVSHRYWTVGHKMFPFFNVPDVDEEPHHIREALGIKNDVEVIAINRKRKWFRRYTGSDYSFEAMDKFIDQVRMGESEKLILPGTFLQGKLFGHEQTPLGEIPLEQAVADADLGGAQKIVEEEISATETAVPEETPVAAKEAEPETKTITGEEITVTQSVASVSAQTTAEGKANKPVKEGKGKDDAKPVDGWHFADEL